MKLKDLEVTGNLLDNLRKEMDSLLKYKSNINKYGEKYKNGFRVMSFDLDQILNRLDKKNETSTLTVKKAVNEIRQVGSDTIILLMHFVNQRLQKLVNSSSSSTSPVEIEVDIKSIGIKCLEKCVQILSHCVEYDTLFAKHLCNHQVKIDDKYSVDYNYNYNVKNDVIDHETGTTGLKELIGAIQLNCKYKNAQEKNLITLHGLAAIATITRMNQTMDNYIKPIACYYDCDYDCNTRYIMPLVADFVRQSLVDRDGHYSQISRMALKILRQGMYNARQFEVDYVTQLVHLNIINHVASIWDIASEKNVHVYYGIQYEILYCFNQLGEACIDSNSALESIASKRKNNNNNKFNNNNNNNDNDKNGDKCVNDLHIIMELIGQIIKANESDKGLDADSLEAISNFFTAMNDRHHNDNNIDYGAVKNEQGINVLKSGCQSVLSLFDHYVEMVRARYDANDVYVSGSGKSMDIMKDYESRVVTDCCSTLAKILDVSVDYSNDTLLMDKMFHQIMDNIYRVCCFHLKLHWRDEWDDRKQLHSDCNFKTNEEVIAYILGLDECKNSQTFAFVRGLVKPLQSMKNVEWKRIRLIWIGYNKNDNYNRYPGDNNNNTNNNNNSKQCYVCLLPKDILQLIVGLLINNRVDALLKLFKC